MTRRRPVRPQPPLPGFEGVAPPPPSEHREQVAFIQRCRDRACRDPRAEVLAYVTAVPNGAYYGQDRKLAAIIGKRMRDEGLAEGFPDLFLPIAMPRPAGDPDPPGGLCILTGWYACWLGEMKPLVGGQVTAKQAEWHARLRAMGCCVDVGRGEDAMYAALCRYLGLPVEG
jgi:hypothetical protein